jgi:flagellar hook assembly protein FlgD
VIPFRLEAPGLVTLEIYDIRGRKVRTVEAGYLAAGEHCLKWDGSTDDHRAAASGVYFYRLTAGAADLTRKMLLLK